MPIDNPGKEAVPPLKNGVYGHTAHFAANATESSLARHSQYVSQSSLRRRSFIGAFVTAPKVRCGVGKNKGVIPLTGVD